MNFPPSAWLILALGVLWLVLRLWSRRAEEQRMEAREARMAELYAERERLLGEQEQPHSLGSVVTDSAPPSAPAGEQRCAGCRTVNPPDAKVCAGCGLEL